MMLQILEAMSSDVRALWLAEDLAIKAGSRFTANRARTVAKTLVARGLAKDQRGALGRCWKITAEGLDFFAQFRPPPGTRCSRCGVELEGPVRGMMIKASGNWHCLDLDICRWRQERQFQERKMHWAW
jgi:predicted transcriptional regulator